MIRIDVVDNRSCLKCGTVEPEMVQIGILNFCLKCSHEEFPDSVSGFHAHHPIYETYTKWLENYYNCHLKY